MKQRRTTATRSRHRAYEETRARSRPSVATVERLKDVGLLFYFTKPKCQTIGDTRLFHLPFVLATCQNPRFGKCNLANHWRCSKFSVGVSSPLFYRKMLIVHTLLFNKFSAGVSPLLFYKEMLIVVVELSKPIPHRKIRKKEE